VILKYCTINQGGPTFSFSWVENKLPLDPRSKKPILAIFLEIIIIIIIIQKLHIVIVGYMLKYKCY
jgi:hypothetical protein